MRARACSGRVVLAACFVLLCGAAAAAYPRDAAEQLAAACASCHRVDGGDSGIPAVIGMREESIVQALQGYRSGARPSLIMHVVAGALSPSEIGDVARYLAARKPGTGHP